ncbi:unnamed protein product [Clonostachys chloroleuca]|uniref:Heterokaryon incompatibility domain-containing protein n=1 Tax=Clonostachys chloroleuca TaxID=1926264 RepID=A0AA35Q100_9HYPO|nr:unnamed protein product [Clonostachys chloroleuca]
MTPKSPAYDGKPIPTFCEWRALAVDEVDEKALLHGIDLGSVAGQGNLPVRLVKFPVEDISLVAVLSWRWDRDLTKSKVSQNILSAVRQAKKMSIQYLFIDSVSIDQHLAGDALIEQVIAFSKLYMNIPVIAAYDTVDEDFEETINRPWIFSELRLCRYNPTKIVYVSSAHQGAEKCRYDTLASCRLGEELWYYNFGRELQRVWSGSYLAPILGVLLGKVRMARISDFKFIISPCAQALATAYEKMSRNDYLLTTFILCGIHSPPDARFNSTYIHLLKCLFEALPYAERVILTALALSNADYEEYVLQGKHERLSSRIVFRYLL